MLCKNNMANLDYKSKINNTKEIKIILVSKKKNLRPKLKAYIMVNN